MTVRLSPDNPSLNNTSIKSIFSVSRLGCFSRIRDKFNNAEYDAKFTLKPLVSRELLQNAALEELKSRNASDFFVDTKCIRKIGQRIA